MKSQSAVAEPGCVCAAIRRHNRAATVRGS